MKRTILSLQNKAKAKVKFNKKNQRKKKMFKFSSLLPLQVFKLMVKELQYGFMRYIKRTSLRTVKKRLIIKIQLLKTRSNLVINRSHLWLRPKRSYALKK